MTEPISPELVEYILLGSGDSRRHMQDSPILGDVWIAYAENPQEPVDLLITSHKDTTANDLAAEIYTQLRGIREVSARDDAPRVAPLQNFVVARLYFDEVLRVLVPMTMASIWSPGPRNARPAPPRAARSRKPWPMCACLWRRGRGIPRPR
jgi:serine protease AprX